MEARGTPRPLYSLRPHSWGREEWSLGISYTPPTPAGRGTSEMREPPLPHSSIPTPRDPFTTWGYCGRVSPQTRADEGGGLDMGVLGRP